jgi:hypothetical protein
MSFLKRIIKKIDSHAPFPDFTAFIVSGFCFGWVCFIAGIWMNQFGRTPTIERGINSAYAIASQTYNLFIKPDSYASKNFFWLPERYQTLGVVDHLPEQFSGEATLLLSSHKQGADLIDQKGEVLHSWSFAYETLLENKIDGGLFYWWKAQVFPNGDILVIVNIDNKTPAGLALFKLDKDSNLLWSYQAPVHHDFNVDQEGMIYVLEQSIQGKAPEELDFLATPYLDEWVTILNSNGEVQEKINLFAAITNSPYRRSIRRIQESISGDYLHPNSVKKLDKEAVKNAPYLEADSLLVDIREIDTIAAISLETKQVYWMLKGPWFYQHDADLLDNGNIMLFDNLSLGKQSRVIEINPQTKQVEWEYKGTEQQPLYSIIRAGQQELENGNVLIYESNASRLLEVNRNKELVWEYYSPIREQDPGSEIKYVPVFMSAERYYKKQLTWLADE